MGKSLSNEEIEKSWGKKFTVIHDDIKQENLSFYENGENIKSFCTPLAEEWKNFFLFCSLGSDYFLGCDGWEHWISQEENDQLEAAKEKADELIRKTKEELWSPQTPWWESSEKKEERFLEKVKEILDQLNQEPENATRIEKIVWEKHEGFKELKDHLNTIIKIDEKKQEIYNFCKEAKTRSYGSDRSGQRDDFLVFLTTLSSERFFLTSAERIVKMENFGIPTKISKNQIIDYLY